MDADLTAGVGNTYLKDINWDYEEDYDKVEDVKLTRVEERQQEELDDLHADMTEDELEHFQEEYELNQHPHQPAQPENIDNASNQ